MKILKIGFLLTALSAVGALTGGCDSSPVPGSGVDPKVEKTQMDKELAMRKLYDKAGGDYSKLDATDKAEMDRLSGGGAASERYFAEIKAGPGGSASSSAPSQP